jgi:hypothetical protein
MKNLQLLVIILFLISCNESKKCDFKNKEIDTLYFKNGKIKEINCKYNNVNDGIQRKYDSLTEKLVYKADFNDGILDGLEYIVPKNEYSETYFYEKGSRKMMSRVSEIIDNNNDIWAKTYYSFITQNKAMELGEIYYTLNGIIDSLSSFYLLTLKDTLKIQKKAKFKLLYFSLKYYDLYKTKLYIFNKEESKLLLDTVLRKTGNRTELELSISPNSCGKQKIRGYIELEDTSTTGKRLVMKKWIYPVYYNFYVKN